MKKKLALLALPLLLALSACSNANGWDAMPIGDDADDDTCYVITAWTSNGRGETRSISRGTFCPKGPVNTEPLPLED